MPGQLTQSIKPSGGDFTSLTSWESQNLDLVTLDSASCAEIQGNWSGTPETTGVTIGGWGTDLTHFAEIRTDSSNRATATWDTSKYILQCRTTNCFDVDEVNFKFRGLQLHIPANGFVDQCGFQIFTLPGEEGAIVIDGCFIRGPNSATGSDWVCGVGLYDTQPGSSSVIVANSIICDFYGPSGNGIYCYSAYDQMTAYNCTSVRNVYNFFQNAGVFKAKNCLSQGYFLGTYDGSSTNNCSDVANNAPGSNARSGSVLFVNSASYDFRLSPYDTVAIGNGISLYTASYAVTTDIAGISRGNATASYFDIGAFHTTQSIKTIKPSGQSGSYTSLASWESGEQVDLISVNKIAIAEIQGNWSGSEDTDRLIINGWSSSVDNEIIIRADSSNRAGASWDSNKYILHPTLTKTSPCISNVISNVSIIGLQIHTEQNLSTAVRYIGINFESSDDPSNCYVAGCVFKSSGTGTGIQYAGAVYAGGTSGVRVENCIAFNYPSPSVLGAGFYFESGTGSCYNCLSYNCVEGFETDGVGLVTVINCLSQNNSDGFVGSFNGSSGYNCSDIASDAPGSNARSGSVLFINSASYDFTLSPNDTVAKDYGTDLSNDPIYPFNTDIDGNTRSAPWDIGASEAMAELSTLRYIRAAGNIFAKGSMLWKA